jgi:hypothetical protein
MIFKEFDPTDVVEGRTTKVASGLWPDGNTYWSSSFFESGFFDLTNPQTPSTAYGSSPFDVRKTLYYTDVYPDLTHKNSYKDPYFSIAYGHFAGSGSFDYETSNIQVKPTKAIYNQYKNLLLGNTDLDGKFSMLSGSTTINADDIFVINFSTYKTKNKIDEGVFQISFTGSKSTPITLIDDSFFVGNAQSVYQLVVGSLNSIPQNPNYQGIGLLYPNDGIAIFNASALNALVGLDNMFSLTTTSTIKDSSGQLISDMPSASYYSGSKSDGMFGSQYVLSSTTDGTTPNPKYNSTLNANLGNQNNTQAFFWSLKHANTPMAVRKSEFVPSRHYFVRVKNREFNYSNNPSYVYDGKELTPTGVKSTAGTIRNEDFFTDPRTYITTVGLYNSTNELVAVAKLSRPAVKTFSNELLIKIRLDF